MRYPMQNHRFRHTGKLHIFGNVRQQLMLVFLLFTLIPILGIGSYSMLNLRQQMMEQHRSQVSAEATRIKSTLFDITTSMYTSCEPLLDAYEYKMLFGTDGFNKENKQQYDTLASALQSMHVSTAAISSIHIYTNNPNIPDSYYISYTPDDYAGCDWYENMDPATTFWSDWSYTSSLADSHRQDTNELTLSRRYAVSSGPYSAYLVIRLSNNYLKNRLIYTDHFILAAIDDNPVFFSSDSRWLEAEFPFGNDFDGDYYEYSGKVLLDNEENLANISTFAPYMTNVKFYILVADDGAYSSVRHITYTNLLMITVAWLFPTLVIIAFSNYFSSRVITLRKAMHQARLGDYDIIDHFQGNDELGETFTDLKATVEMIQEKEKLYYQSQITEQQRINHQQQMEFKMLASQINPHFLYNTLELIHMQALGNQDREVASSIKLLGKSMHYVLENTGTNATTLAKELEYIKTYLAIQKLRFGDHVNYAFDIDSSIDLDHCKILPLLLQPIVENAVIHGLEGTKINGLVTLSIHPTIENELEFKVFDNGQGMTPEELQTLIDRVTCDKLDTTSSIGLHNINQRVQLLYGKQYQLQITSELHQGTCVSLVLPQDYIY